MMKYGLLFYADTHGPPAFQVFSKGILLAAARTIGHRNSRNTDITPSNEGYSSKLSIDRLRNLSQSACLSIANSLVRAVGMFVGRGVFRFLNVA